MLVSFVLKNHQIPYIDTYMPHYKLYNNQRKADKDVSNVSEYKLWLSTAKPEATTPVAKACSEKISSLHFEGFNDSE